MCKLIILRGNSGSGKTTIAKELQKIIGSNTLLVSQDAVRREMLMVSDGPDTKALPMLKELLRYGKDHCETVIPVRKMVCRLNICSAATETRTLHMRSIPILWGRFFPFARRSKRVRTMISLWSPAAFMIWRHGSCICTMRCRSSSRIRTKECI